MFTSKDVIEAAAKSPIGGAVVVADDGHVVCDIMAPGDHHPDWARYHKARVAGACEGAHRVLPAKEGPHGFWVAA